MVFEDYVQQIQKTHNVCTKCAEFSSQYCELLNLCLQPRDSWTRHLGPEYFTKHFSDKILKESCSESINAIDIIQWII